MRFVRLAKPFAALIAALVLAAGSGFLVSTAIGGSSAAARTVTINVATGATGPAGPPGPPGPQGDPGPAGASTCPTGFTAGLLVINHPGGQTSVWTCIKD